MSSTRSPAKAVAAIAPAVVLVIGMVAAVNLAIPSLPLASARSTALVARIGARATSTLGLALVGVGLVLLSFATAATPYPPYGAVLALIGAGMGLAMPPLSGMIVHALPQSNAGVASGLNSTTRELGSALGVAVLGTILATHFAAHLPPALAHLGGASGEAVKHSVAAAIAYAESATVPAVRADLLDGTREAFTAGTSLGLRVGAGLVLLSVAAIALRPKEGVR